MLQRLLRDLKQNNELWQHSLVPHIHSKESADDERQKEEKQYILTSMQDDWSAYDGILRPVRNATITECRSPTHLISLLPVSKDSSLQVTKYRARQEDADLLGDKDTYSEDQGQRYKSIRKNAFKRPVYRFTFQSKLFPLIQVKVRAGRPERYRLHDKMARCQPYIVDFYCIRPIPPTPDVNLPAPHSSFGVP